jgi:transposase InsO family protein
VYGTLAGEKIRKALGQTSWDAATALINAWTASREIGVVKAEAPTIREAVGKFFDDCEARRLGWEAMRKYRHLLEDRFIPWNAAIHGRGTPRHLSTDHDPLFEAHRWTANLRILEIDEIKTVPHVPLSHPFVERLIGTMRREFLDHVLFWNARDLERKLADFQADYNAARSHASLEGHTPLTFAGGHTVAVPS